MSYQIKELGVTEILDQAFTLIKDHFAVLFGITMMIVFPYYLFINFFPMFMFGNLEDFAADAPADAEIVFQDPRFDAPVIDPSMMLTYAAVAFGGAITLLPLANASVIYAVSKVYMGQEVSVGEALRFGLKKILPLIWVSFLVGIIVMLGFIAFIIPGIIFYIRYLISQHVVVLENASASQALKRCKVLMKDNYGKAFAVNFIMGLIMGGVGTASQMIPQIHTQLLVSTLANSITIILAATAFVVFYFSARCQHENYDLELLANSFSDEDYQETYEENDDEYEE